MGASPRDELSFLVVAGGRIKLALLASLACLSLVACGKSHHGDDDDDGGDSGAAGQAPEGGGATSRGGTGGSGTTNGGSSTSGGGGSMAGHGGSAGGTGGASANGGSTPNGGIGAVGGGGTEPQSILGDIPDLPLLRADGRDLIAPNDAIVRLRGVAFGNDVWSEPQAPVTTHHAEADFARLQQWGANVTRFYLNYQLLEETNAPGLFKQAGFDWLDENIRWAAKNGIYLIFNMHVPAGGFQSNGDGDLLWLDPQNQERLIALWRQIAWHCKGIGAVAGYDLLNEPRPLADRSEWTTLATKLTSAIREVDPDHLIVVERTNSVGEDWSNDESMNFFRVPDDNVMYEFHFYEPFEYTTQLASWLDLPEGGKYPDETLISSANLSWYNWSYEPSPPPYAPFGDSDWTLYESDQYVIEDSMIKVLGIALISELNSGTVWFDDVFIDEYAPDGTFSSRIFEQDLESMTGWSFWQAGATGMASVSTEAHSGKASLSITNTDHDANLQNAFRFPVKPGFRYTVGGYMKGQAIPILSRQDPRGDWIQSTRALIRLDYYSATGDLLARDAAALGASLDKFLAWGAAENVPLFVGEFGLIHYCFEDGRGGTNWVRDMLDLMLQRDLNFTYHVYHEVNFGIFQSEASKLPDLADANQPLIDVIQDKLLDGR